MLVEPRGLPRAWTVAFLYIKRLSKCVRRVESGTWCRCPIFVVNSNDKEGLHWFVCAFDCCVRLELFTIWVWEPLSSTHLICPFLLAMKKLSLATKHRALGFQMDGWSCGFQSLNIAKLVVEHRGTFSDVPLIPMDPGFVDYVLSIVNADHAAWDVEAPRDDVEGVTELPCPPEPPPPPSTQVEGALSAIEESVQATPPHSKARRPPPSRVWKAWRLGRNLPWPLTKRRTSVPRSSSVESGTRCRMAPREMHLAS